MLFKHPNYFRFKKQNHFHFHLIFYSIKMSSVLVCFFLIFLACKNNQVRQLSPLWWARIWFLERMTIMSFLPLVYHIISYVNNIKNNWWNIENRCIRIFMLNKSQNSHFQKNIWIESDHEELWDFDLVDETQFSFEFYVQMNSITEQALI